MKRLIIYALSLSLTFNVHAKPKTADQGRDWVTAAIQEIAVQEALRITQVEYQLARTPEKYEKKFLKGFSPRDRQYFRKVMKGVKLLPEVRIEDRKIIIQDGSPYETVVELVSKGKNQFKVNGSLWTYLPNQPLESQIDVLLRSYPPKRSGASLWNLLIIENAYADGGLTAIAILTAVTMAFFAGTGSGAIDKLLSTRICADTQGLGDRWYHFQPRRAGFCEEFDQKELDKKKRNSPHFDAIEQLVASDKSNVLTKFKVEGEFACPDNNDGKIRVYKANLIVSSTNQPIAVDINFTPEGKVKDFKLFSRPQLNEIAKIEFDNNFMKCAVIKRAKSPLATSPLLTPNDQPLCRNETGLNSEDLAQLQLLEDAVKFINLRVARCTVQAIADKVEEKGEQEIGSPAQPKANDQASTKPQGDSHRTPARAGARK